MRKPQSISVASRALNKCEQLQRYNENKTHSQSSVSYSPIAEKKILTTLLFSMALFRLARLCTFIRNWFFKQQLYDETHTHTLDIIKHDTDFIELL